ncbi:hypothetical protein BDN67DRAFT_1017611 [Paxillus ammoniavirescens]|nr:hypothetical protein BDN67DRAFT_1017611 [Paxillus ammoniavirescens]
MLPQVLAVVPLHHLNCVLQLLQVILSTNFATKSTGSINHACDHKDNSTLTMQSYETIPYIFTWDTRPLPHEMEQGPCFHFWSYICFGQRNPNINPDQNVAPPTAQLGLSVWLWLRKPPPPLPTTTSPSTNVQYTLSPHMDSNDPIPLPNQPSPSNAITSPVDTAKVQVHPSMIFSETLSLRAQAPAPVDLNADMDDAQSEGEPNPWLPADAGRVDPTVGIQT